MADRLNSASTLLYLYGITQSAASLPVALHGVDGVAPISNVACSGLMCWVSRVGAREFGDDLTRNMENLEWLADASVRHQRVVGAIHELQPILPARFGTVFRNERSLCEDVAARKTALDASFRRIGGADEWGLRVFAVRAATPAAAGARSGKEYLQRKSALLQARPSRTLEPEIQDFAAAVAKLATATAEGGKVGAGQPGLRWQISLLLPRSRRANFDDLLRRFSAKFSDRFRLECTGPWPPYSFVVHSSDEQASSKPRKAAH